MKATVENVWVGIELKIRKYLILLISLFILQIVCKYSFAKCAFQKQNLALFYYMSYIRQRNTDKILTQIELNLYNKNIQIP